MKITIIQGAFFPVPAIKGGAVEKIWCQLAREFVARGHHVVHIGRTHPDLPDTEELDGIKYVRVRGYDSPSSMLALKFMDLLYTLRASRKIPHDSDIIVTNTFWSPLLIQCKHKRNIFVSVERWPKGQMRLYWRASRLRANTHAVADAIRNEVPFDWGERIVVIPNPLPFQPRAFFGLAVKESIVLYVGRIHPEKGLHLLVSACKQLPPGWRLQIVGPWEVALGGGGLEYFERLKCLAGSTSRVEFAGAVFNADHLHQYYARASIFVYPSLSESGETFGLAPLEAMSWGCVPVVSALSCFRDFIEHMRNGLVFDHRAPDAIGSLWQTIDRLQTSAVLCRQLAAEALKVNETHCPTSIASRFITEFERILDQ